MLFSERGTPDCNCEKLAGSGAAQYRFYAQGMRWNAIFLERFESCPASNIGSEVFRCHPITRSEPRGVLRACCFLPVGTTVMRAVTILTGAEERLFGPRIFRAPTDTFLRP